MKTPVTLFFLTFFFSVNGQIIDNHSTEIFAEDPVFNPIFIRNNKISSIKGYYSTKADLDRIRSNKNIYVYEFNPKGQLIKDYKTRAGDTIVRMYEYDDNSNLIFIRKTDRFGYHAYTFEYDSLNRMTKKTYSRDLNRTINKIDFVLDRSYIISEQTFGYEATSKGIKKLYYNSVGKVYKTELFYYDTDGYLIKQEATSKTGSGTDKTEYSYNLQGLLKEKKTTSFLTNNNTTRIQFEYDAHENVMAQHFYRNEVYKTEYQIVYDSRTLLLSALLSRDVESNIITILKFSDYTYFD